MNIDSAIRIYAEFLNASWNIVNPLLENRGYNTKEQCAYDWLQANWELLVERKVLPLDCYLTVYGSGADFNKASSRITDVNALPTHDVNVWIEEGMDLLNGVILKQTCCCFEELVNFKEPFFNCVLATDLINHTERIFSLSDIVFQLKAI